MSSHIVASFDEDLVQIQAKISEMGGVAEEMLSKALESVQNRDAEDFSLEVLSAGVSEPLQLKRQFAKNLGRDLKVKTTEGKLEGTLSKANEEGITLQWKEREPKPTGKGKVTVQKEAVVPFKDIVEAKVMIKF